jgi:hypothetical protein
VNTLQQNTGKQCGKNFVENQCEKLARGFGKRMLEVTKYFTPILKAKSISVKIKSWVKYKALKSKKASSWKK